MSDCNIKTLMCVTAGGVFYGPGGGGGEQYRGGRSNQIDLVRLALLSSQSITRVYYVK